MSYLLYLHLKLIDDDLNNRLLGLANVRKKPPGISFNLANDLEILTEKRNSRRQSNPKLLQQTATAKTCGQKNTNQKADKNRFINPENLEVLITGTKSALCYILDPQHYLPFCITMMPWKQVGIPTMV